MTTKPVVEEEAMTTKIQWMVFATKIVAGCLAVVWFVVTIYAYPLAEGRALEAAVKERWLSVEKSITRVEAAMMALSKTVLDDSFTQRRLSPGKTHSQELYR
jgi:hypothetical protein